jgi:hypothetical protein
MITTATTSYVDIQGVKSQTEYTDYTMEFYFRYDGGLPTSGEDVFISSNDSNFIVLRYHDNGRLYVRGGQGGNGHNNIDFDGCTVVANTWHHIAVVRENQRLFMYFDGVKRQYTGGPGTNTTDEGNADLYSVNSSGSSLMQDADLMLFSYANDPTQFNFIGSLSNVRLSAKAVYHHTNSDYAQPKSFTVPSLPLSTSQSAGTNIASLQSSDVWLLVNADPDNAGQVKNTSEYAVTSITNTGTITTETGMTQSPF